MAGAAPFSSMPKMNAIAKQTSYVVSSKAIDRDKLAAARKGEYVYGKNNGAFVQPSNAPNYKILTKNLQDLFERAFATGVNDPTSRPSEEEFYKALSDYYDSLVMCSCGRHYMPSYYHGICEWCRLERLDYAMAHRGDSSKYGSK